MNRFRSLSKIVLIFTLAFASLCTAHAQQITGEITGTVTDASGALIPGAKIVVTNLDTKEVVRTINSDSKGVYAAPLLQVGNYSITASAPNFVGKTIDNLEVDVSASVKADFQLVAGDTTTVNVTDANTMAPDLESGAVGTVISGTEMKDLALNTHNFEQLIQLQPGVSFGGTSDQLYTGLVSPSSQRNSAGVSINGLRSDQNAYLLDGADMLEHNTGQGAVIFPSIEAIQQLQVMRNSYGAEYGGGGNAQIQVVTKAGGSAYHGDVHLYVRNAIFNANDYFNNLVGKPRPQDNQYTYGFAMGGPVFIPHVVTKDQANTFFFYAFEGHNDAVSQVNQLANIPTPAEIQGIFTDNNICYGFKGSGYACKAGDALPAGTQIPASAINPLSAAYVKDIFQYFPVPNSPTDAHTAIFDQLGTHYEAEQFFRLDHAFGSRLNTFFRFVYDPISVTSPSALYSGSIQQYAPYAVPGAANTAAQTKGTAYLVHATYALTSSTTIDASLSYEPYSVIAQPVGTFASVNAPDVEALLQLPFPVALARVPTLTVTPGTYGAAGPVRDINETYQASSNLLHVIGRHSIGVGVNWELYREAVNQGTTNAGEYLFDTGDFEQSFAAFLSGSPTSFTQSSVDPMSNAHINMAEGYVEDDWKILPRLTLNMGLRYSFFHAPETARQTLGSFEPQYYVPSEAPTIDTNGLICTVASANGAACTGGGSPNPNYNPLNGLVIGEYNSPEGRPVNHQPLYDFAPRFGFAMDVFGDGKTSLKGGYGIYYDQTQLNIVHQSVYNNPYYVQVVSFPDPFPAASGATFQAPGSTGAAAAGLNPLPADGIARTFMTPNTQGYSLEVQQEFPYEIIFDIAYSGNTSKHQPGQIDINQPYQGEYIKADLPGLYNGNLNICPGNATTNTCTITAANTTILNQIRPFLGYSAIVSENSSFIANYNSLQTSYNQRINGSSRLSVNYTWSRGLTNSQGTTTPGGGLSGAPQNSYCLQCEYGPVNFDRRNVLTVHYQYLIPYYKRGQHGLYQHLVGGFELSGIVTAAAGLSLTPKVANADPAGVGIVGAASPETERPNLIGANPNDNAPHTRTSWIGNYLSSLAGGPNNPFVPAPPYLGLSGNASVGSIRGPGYQVWNLGVFKNTDIKDNEVLQFRIQAFNAFNHVNWTTIMLQMTGGNADSAFAQVTNDRDPREMELGLKFTF